MSWTWEQISGRMFSDNGDLIGVGYSGSGDYKNKPDAQTLHDLGPIPIGTYFISAPENTVTHGPYVMPLMPESTNQMFGRSGFLIHGDSVVSPGFASEGCIILSRDVRQQIWESGDHVLDVIAVVPKS